jgi:hypothetical protein
MANLVRSEKSGSSWGVNKLIAFNIEIIDVNAQTFFGNAILPQVTLSPVILDNFEEPAGPLHKADMDLFAYMEDAMIIPPGEESLVDDFAAFVLKMMRYDEGSPISTSLVGIWLCIWLEVRSLRLTTMAGCEGLTWDVVAVVVS